MITKILARLVIAALLVLTFSSSARALDDPLLSDLVLLEPVTKESSGMPPELHCPTDTTPVPYGENPVKWACVRSVPQSEWPPNAPNRKWQYQLCEPTRNGGTAICIVIYMECDSNGCRIGSTNPLLDLRCTFQEKDGTVQVDCTSVRGKFRVYYQLDYKKGTLCFKIPGDGDLICVKYEQFPGWPFQIPGYHPPVCQQPISEDPFEEVPELCGPGATGINGG